MNPRPVRDYNCRLVYLTPAGHRRHSHHKTRATTANDALDVAERQLRADKRRRVDLVIYGKAIPQ